MEGLKTFLESSTIHGLSYISTTKRYVRLFWTVIVIAGFTGAGIIIYQSFDDWAENPVTTTLETLPIKELTFPKVTVCPPKNTNTNLNYDLERMKNMTLDDNIRKKLVNMVLKLIQDYTFDQVMSNLSKITEENRFYNWYAGLSEVSLPYWGEDTDPGCKYLCKDNLLRYHLNTSSVSGSISTQYYGNNFTATKMEKEIK